MTNSMKNRKLNKGFSLVEVLIALAIFMILMTPLVTSITHSMRSTTTAKELQYRNDYAEGLMEQLKSMPMDDIKDQTAVTNALTELGSEAIAAGGYTFAADTMAVQGAVNLKVPSGTRQYSYRAEIKKDPSFPATTQSGYVESLDKNKVVLIDGAALGNYDDDAYKALFLKYLAGEQSKNNYNETTALGNYKNVRATRSIKIKVTKNGTKYQVKSTLTYNDTHNSIDYNLYNKSFDDELPNMYLLYNVGVFNELYTNDYISVEMPDEDEESKLFVIETVAATMEETAGTPTEVTATEDTTGIATSVIVNSNTVQRRRIPERSSEARSLQKLTYKDGVNVGNLNVYHNIATANFSTDNFAATVSDLAEVEKNGGLYTVKVWMTEGTFDTGYDFDNKAPILKGTREGR